MPRFKAWSGLLLLCCFAAAAGISQAASIRYTFTAGVVGGSGAALGLADGTLLQASFTYDNAVSASATNVNFDLTVPALAPYGLFSVYPDAITDFTGHIGGHDYSALMSQVLVGDGSADPASGFFARIGNQSQGWSGFGIGNYQLVGTTMFTVGSSAMLADQSLPDAWWHFSQLPGGANSGINMVFADIDSGALQTVNVWGDTTLQQVPLPATLGLLGMGLAVLGGIRRRRA
jgi:hypothetical protein